MKLILFLKATKKKNFEVLKCHDVMIIHYFSPSLNILSIYTRAKDKLLVINIVTKVRLFIKVFFSLIFFCFYIPLPVNCRNNVVYLLKFR